MKTKSIIAFVHTSPNQTPWVLLGEDGSLNKGQNWTLTGVRKAFCLQNSLTSFVTTHCNQKRQTMMTLSSPTSATTCRKRPLARMQFRNRESTRPISLHNYGWLFLLIFLWIYSLLCENNRHRSSREFTRRTHSETNRSESQAQICEFVNVYQCETRCSTKPKHP